jgi:hypothetical protein
MCPDMADMQVIVRLHRRHGAWFDGDPPELVNHVLKLALVVLAPGGRPTPQDGGQARFAAFQLGLEHAAVLPGPSP